MSGQYVTPVRLQVTFEAPETTTLVLQGPALEAYYEMLESGSDEASEHFMDALVDQCADHVAQWTRIADWDRAY